jgi:nucleoside phosphorylase
MLFLGVAGGLGAGVKVGDVVVADALLQHDLDVSPLFPRHEVPLTGLARFPADPVFSNTVARGTMAALAGSGATLHRGLIVSGDRFVSTAAESQALRAALPDALAVEMEGAAVAQVCHAFGTPLAVVRSISDRADDTAHVDFGRFLREVASPLGLASSARPCGPALCRRLTKREQTFGGRRTDAKEARVVLLEGPEAALQRADRRAAVAADEEAQRAVSALQRIVEVIGFDPAAVPAVHPHPGIAAVRGTRQLHGAARSDARARAAVGGCSSISENSWSTSNSEPRW